VFLDAGKKVSSRKFVQVSEIKDANQIVDVFSWNASSDVFQERLEESVLLKRLARKMDIPFERLLSEFEYRKKVLQNMVEHNVRDHRSVNKVLSKYYHDPSMLENETFRNFKR
jgi:hypothetical protein